jgi:glucosamine-6-phosphate deaminase
MEVIKVRNYKELSKKAAEIIIQKVKQSNAITLGLATGSTPEGLYRELITEHRLNKTSYQHVTTFNLDEYVGIEPEDSNSYHYYMVQHLFSGIDILQENTHIPSGIAKNLAEECLKYDQLVESSGGIDLQILGIGQNGHIGFNEPGTSFESKTHVVQLKESTREANARFFPKFETVPTHAITMGISTILKSKQILLLVSGEKKAEALQQLLYGEISEEFPSSVLKLHPNVTIIGDNQALSLGCQIGPFRNP